MHYRSIVHIQVMAAIITIAAVFIVTLRIAVPETSIAKAALATTPYYSLPFATAIFMVMWERGSCPEKISGYLGQPNKSIFGAFLQNTLEQTLLALLSVAAFATYAPSKLSPVVTASGWVYVLGRLLFFIGYRASPMWRFYGFSLNFYTSVALLVASIWFMSQGA